ncbi:MAG: hypothetical protein H6566_23400 [Lewinellaceae bacterium]|nr:hypothetical protein [Lewinellaceae bacterium]
MKSLEKSILWLALLGPLSLTAQQSMPPRQVDVAVGLHSYYIPAMGAHWNGPEPAVYAGVNQPINQKGTLGLSLRLGYSRGQYQGDALQAQLLFGVTPVIAQHLEVGVGLGIGYQFSFYPTQSFNRTEGQWVKGRRAKGVMQAPLQLSLGYRTVHFSKVGLTPYVAYQLQALFGYSPDLSPLPVSNALLGVKISPIQ